MGPQVYWAIYSCITTLSHIILYFRPPIIYSYIQLKLGPFCIDGAIGLRYRWAIASTYLLPPCHISYLTTQLDVSNYLFLRRIKVIVTETVSQAIISRAIGGAIGIALWAILYTGYNMWAKLYRLEGHIAQFVPLLYMGHVISPIIQGQQVLHRGPYYTWAIMWAKLYRLDGHIAPFVPLYMGHVISPCRSLTILYHRSYSPHLYLFIYLDISNLLIPPLECIASHRSHQPLTA